MKEEYKRCWNCFNYAAFYTKGNGCFKQEKIGKCKVKKKIVDKQDACKNWILRPLDTCSHKGAIQKNLAEILEKVTSLEQILKEEIEYEESVTNSLFGRA